MSKFSIVAIFCEDIREEKGGTETLVGMMPDNIQVPTVPGAIPKIGIYIRAHINKDMRSELTDLNVILRFPDGTTLPVGTATKADIVQAMNDSSKDVTYVGMILKAMAGGFPIPATGLIQVLAQFGGQEYICGQMNVQLETAVK